MTAGSWLPPSARASLGPRAMVKRPRAVAKRPPPRANYPRDSAAWKRRMARLNHILIPAKKSDRDRLRSSRLVRALTAPVGAYHHLSPEGRALLLIAVPVGLAALDVRFSQVYFLFAMLVGLLLGSWICRPLFRIRGLRVDIRAPSRVSVGATTHFELELSNHGQQPLLNLRLNAPFLPWDGSWTLSPEGVPRLEPGQRLPVKAQAVFQARGEHHLDSFEVGQLVTTGLVVGPCFHSAGARFLVVPKIANVLSVGLEAMASHLDRGLAAAVKVGETELAGVRPYRIGDPLKHLHARTWARTGMPHVREFVDPQDERVALVVVTGGAENSELEKEAALCVAAGVAARLTLHGRGVDVLLVDETPTRVQPRSGEAALDAVLDRLATLEFSNESTSSFAAAAEVFARCTCAVVISAGTDSALAGAVERMRKRGRPCPWVAVVNDRRRPVHPAASKVDVASVEAGGSIAL